MSIIEFVEVVHCAGCSQGGITYRVHGVSLCVKCKDIVQAHQSDLHIAVVGAVTDVISRNRPPEPMDLQGH
jgi:hypothetical protein